MISYIACFCRFGFQVTRFTFGGSMYNNIEMLCERKQSLLNFHHNQVQSGMTVIVVFL